MEDAIFNALSNFGFPAVVCFYLMTSVVKSIDKNTTALEALKDELRQIFLSRRP